MKTADQIGITFANIVISSGVYQGVVNVELGTLQWSYNEETKQVDPDPILVARLRLDVECARQLHEALGSRLELLNKPAATKSNGIAAEETPTVN